MTLPLGLDQSGMDRLGETLCMDHNVKILVSLMDINHNHLMDLSDRLFDGQVNISAKSTDATRSASLSIWDPKFELGLDDLVPDAYANFYRKMIRVTYCVWRYGDTSSVDIPIFTGPITATGRDGQGMLQLTCMGKEVLAKAAIWDPTAFPKGYAMRTALQFLMTQRAGETKLSLEASNAKFGAKRSYAREAIIWDEAKVLATAMQKQAFYDGRGTFRSRTFPTTVSWRFRDGRGGSIVTKPTRNNDDTDMKNRVWAIGAAPKGSKTVPSAVATLPNTHPLSPGSLGRVYDGKVRPRVLLNKIDASTLTTKAQVQGLVDTAIDDYEAQNLALRADVLVIPFLEEYDLIQMSIAGEYNQQMRLGDYTIPFIGPVASWGTTKNLATKKKR